LSSESAKFVEILSNLLEVGSHLLEICSVYQKLQLFALPKFLGSPKFVRNLFFLPLKLSSKHAKLGQKPLFWGNLGAKLELSKR